MKNNIWVPTSALLLWLSTAPLGAAAAEKADVFTEEARATGLDFVHFNGMSGERYFNEIVGPGIALLDYDNDGDLDAYAVQGAMLGLDKTLDDALFPPRHPPPLTDRLYRNDLVVHQDGRRTLRFTDVTAAAGLESLGYGMGVAAGDYDNDGFVDVYVTNHGSNQMLRNRGDGSFADVTAKTGTDDRRWSTSAAFLDFDGDGWLDLYVANYVGYDIAQHTSCPQITGEPGYCGPLSYPPESDRLFRNRGDGADGIVTFEDVTLASGLGREKSSGLGVVTADFNGDGWPDFYVANDLRANNLWLNQRRGEDGRVSFVDDALLGGCSASSSGELEASMGVVAGDLDGDGDEDLFMAHLRQQTNTIYLNDGSGLFHDASLETGLGSPSWPFTGFGTAVFDYDNDGWLDLMVVNGAIKELDELRKKKDPFPLHQPNQLFRNLGATDGRVRFAETTGTAGAVFELSEVSRGAAVGDVDNDGDADVLVANNNAATRLLINQVGHHRHWLGLRLVDPATRRDAVGARAALHRAGKPPLWRTVRGDGSYLSSHDLRLLFGLGDSPEVERVRVVWPGGLTEEWTEVTAGAYTTLRKGSGRPAGEKEGTP